MNLNSTQTIFYCQTQKWAYLIPKYTHHYLNNLIKKYVTKIIIETVPNYNLKYKFFQNYDPIKIKEKQKTILLKDLSIIIWQLKKSGFYKYIIISFVLTGNKLAVKLKCYFNPVIKKISITGFHTNVIKKKKLSQIIKYQLGLPENFIKFRCIVQKIKNEYDKEGYFWIKYSLSSSKNKTNYNIEIIPYLIDSIQFNYSHHLNNYESTFLKSFIITKLNLQINNTLNYYIIKKGISELKNKKLISNCKYNVIYLSNNRIKVIITCALKPSSFISTLNYKLCRYERYYSFHRKSIIFLITYHNIMDHFKKIHLNKDKILKCLYSMRIDKVLLDEYQLNFFIEKQKNRLLQKKDYYYFFLAYKYEDLIKNHCIKQLKLYYNINLFNDKSYSFIFNSYGNIYYLINNQQKSDIFQFIYLQNRSQNICHKINVINNDIFNKQINLSRAIILHDSLHYNINNYNFHKKINYYKIFSLYYTFLTSRDINNHTLLDNLTFYYKNLFILVMSYLPKNSIFLFKDFSYSNRLIYKKNFLYPDYTFNNSDKILDMELNSYLLINRINENSIRYFQKQITILTLRWLYQNQIIYYLYNSKLIDASISLYISNYSAYKINNWYQDKSYYLELGFNLITKIRPLINIQYKIYSDYRSKLYLYLFR